MIDVDVDRILDDCLVRPGKKFRLKDHDPSWSGDRSIPKEKRKEVAANLLAHDVATLAEAQDLLYAANAWSILIILQAMDAAGKDGTVKHVMSGVNPQGCEVSSFKQPSAEELDHSFLWRYVKRLPERGKIGIFNRSYYEDVLVVKVHADTLAARQAAPGSKVDGAFWQDRYSDINNLEKHLVRNATVVLKFFLNISKDEQRKRFLSRLDDPAKNWKFSPSDISERALWDRYQEAYEDAIAATSTEHAPWYVVPYDAKWVGRSIVAAAIVRAVRQLKLKQPAPSDALRAQIDEARKTLEAEED